MVWLLTGKTDGANVTTYDYSSRGELLNVILPDGTVIDYVYDPLGRRIAKKVDGVTIEKYLWQGLTHLLAVYAGSNNLLMRFEYADGRMPVSMTRSDGTYYFTYDQVGSLRVVANATGMSVKTIDYDSFGNTIYDTNPSFEVPLAFAGGLYDRDTGLVRFGYRDYDPDVGRWTSKDPILFNGGSTDLYGYCINDPVNCVDPLGLFDIGKALGYGASVWGGITAGGPGSLIGGFVGGVIGGALGGVPGAVLGGIVVGYIGSAFDPLSAGQLNYGEDEAIEWRLRIEQLEIEARERESLLQDLLDRVNELNNRMGGPLDDDACE